jgi:hypothetical protein
VAAYFAPGCTAAWSASASVTCYNCDRVLPAKVDLLDSLGGTHGICEGCAKWKANYYAELQQRTGSAPATAVPEYFTHFARHAEPQWIAIHRPSALDLLKGYDLTEGEKTDVSLLMLGYCNLLERAGLVHGGATEAEAVASARPCKNVP